MEYIIDIYGKVDFEQDGDTFYTDLEDKIRDKQGNVYRAKFILTNLELIGAEDEDEDI